ncbi:vascular non-inflammatory molecule 3 [Parasteatoda tepidariorum]|uniref:vascular non-inflammatory molecule 3 n=1 Tax=Parasteatoda tepidariorum TaxID=114398 RepID=UPI001C71E4BB|nr:vascular non-inflammatory molecule 3 isoform X1 [Parasteatoda tepidariorum]
MNNCLVFLCLLLPGIALGRDYFTAAVLEHRPRTDNTSQESPIDIISSNLKIFEKAIPLAAKKGADIIVFNEYGLYQHVTNKDRLKEFAENIPDPRKRKYNPCLDKEYHTFILSSLSCYAREYNIYIVANFGNIQTCSDTCDANRIDECTNCPKDGVRIYNTNVAFDREGSLVARYHKTHTYFEHVNAAEEMEFITFKTDFGTFGLQICFDAVFEESVLLARDHGIDTLLFPTFWYDDILPFNAVEFQQAWALANGVNFIAANVHKPGTGSLGSGIYSKDTGALVYTYDPDGHSKLLMANIRINDKKDIPRLSSIATVTEDGVFERQNEEGINFPEYCYYPKAGPFKNVYTDYRCYKSHIERHSRIKLESPFGEIESCHQGFCCHLKYSAESMNENFYLTSFSGANDVRNYFYFQEQTCLLIRCDPYEDKACVIQPSSSTTVFRNVEMKARFESQKIFATVSLNRFRLAPKQLWNYSTDDYETTLTFKADSNEPLLKVGLFGRNYEKDPPYIPYKHYE